MKRPTLAPALVLRNYFHAKDENRPRLLDQVFSEDAVLEVRNTTATISFPAKTVGREAIADVLVRTFGQTYENVYSFYIDRPTGELAHFRCDWLVAMTEKSSRKVRVGCGNYEWEFDNHPPGLARRLVISIAAMQVLPPSTATKVYAWVSGLTYPWSSRAEVVADARALDELAPILQVLGAGEHAA